MCPQSVRLILWTDKDNVSPTRGAGASGPSAACVQTKGKDKIMDTATVIRNAVKGGEYHVYEAPAGVRRSYAPTTRRCVTPSGTGRPVRYGDRIFVRLTRMQYGVRTLAEFTLSEVNDLSEIYGELRHYTRGERGLTRLYIRNITRGWSMEQPFMLYAGTRRETSVAASVAGPKAGRQPALGRREIPESIRLLYGDH